MAEIKSEDTAYAVPENPQYDPIIRKLKVSDPAHAETVFNPLFQQILNNIHAVKLSDEKKAKQPVVTKVQLITSNWIGGAVPFTQAVVVKGIVKTNSIESLLYVVAENTVENADEIGDCNIMATEINKDSITFTASKRKPSVDVKFIIINIGEASI